MTHTCPAITVHTGSLMTILDTFFIKVGVKIIKIQFAYMAVLYVSNSNMEYQGKCIFLDGDIYNCLDSKRNILKFFLYESTCVEFVGVNFKILVANNKID